MLNKLFENKFKIVITILIVVCLGIIRALENQLFYDPFLVYFDSDFKGLLFPQADNFKLLTGLLFRYCLNTILSLMLIYALFRNNEILKFSAFLYVCFLVVLIGMFFVILEYFPNAGWLLFYVRRFIIQPIFVLLFVPAFYYQEQNLKK
ncbi:exosortase F system-associated membrane protein [Flavobacterium ajazii]|uniref:exosortase F system-associated membrane protein n=1 Tax=Flavobacterium ajazii TaxID=2692318 RepID=UPI0013D00612|nr:exosortase F system-associated protein [Flavobacterium ajazii]